MRCQLLWLTPLVLGSVLCGCTGPDDPDILQSSPLDLIPNSSFESNGVASLEGWTIGDSSFVRSVNIAAPSGGQWSLSIQTAPFPGSYAFERVPATEGTHRYRYSLWAKFSGQTYGAAGVSLWQYPGSSLVRTVFLPHDTTWTLHSVIDTLTASAQDSLVFLLIGGSNDNGVGQTFFDLCRIERLD